MANFKAVLFLVCLPALTLAAAKLRKLDHDSAKPGEYIALLKHVPDEATAARFSSLVDEVDGARLVRIYTIGNSRLALIKATDDAVNNLTQLPYIDLLETNQMVYLDDPIHEPVVADVPAHSSGDYFDVLVTNLNGTSQSHLTPDKIYAKRRKPITSSDRRF